MNNKPQAIADKDYVYGAISIIREIFDTPHPRALPDGTDSVQTGTTAQRLCFLLQA